MRPFRQLLFVGLPLAVAMVAPACLAADSEAGSAQEQVAETTVPGQPEFPRTTGIPTMRPTSAEVLGIVLDESGRPYDYYQGPQASTTETRLLTRLQVDRGRLEIVDGEAFYEPLPVTVRDTESVNFRTATELDLRIVWQQQPSSEPGLESAATDDSQDGKPTFYPVGDGRVGLVEAVLGVQLSVRGSEVARWSRFEAAYETDDGLGAVTSRAVLEWADENLEFGEPLLKSELPQDRAYLLADFDGQPGQDFFLFDNGGGEGSYRLTEGFDDEDQLVAVMLWHARYPWRLAVPTGSPPPDVVEREQELLDCIDGRRLIDKWGRCT